MKIEKSNYIRIEASLNKRGKFLLQIKNDEYEIKDISDFIGRIVRYKINASVKEIFMNKPFLIKGIKMGMINLLYNCRSSRDGDGHWTKIENVFL